MGQRCKHFFFAFLCVSAHSKWIETHLFSKIFVRAKRVRCGRDCAAPDCDTSDCDLLVMFIAFDTMLRLTLDLDLNPRL